MLMTLDNIHIHSTLSIFGATIKFVTVDTFAKVTNRKPEQIRRLIRNGNTIRRLNAMKINNYFYLIPYTEIFEYPFVEPGRTGNKIKYHRYNEDGTISLMEIPTK